MRKIVRAALLALCILALVLSYGAAVWADEMPPLLEPSVYMPALYKSIPIFPPCECDPSKDSCVC